MAEIENEMGDIKLETTPNIEFQVSNFHPKEYIGHKGANDCNPHKSGVNV